MLVACGGGSTVAPGSPDAAPGSDDVVADAAPIAPKGPFPLVLAHGLFGFNNIGPLDYFYGVRDALTAKGRQVFAPEQDAVQSSEVRGQQLDAAIHDVLAQTGAAKVVIIGHSQGGMDARWVASHDPDVVAAVVTIATPHLGSPVADVSDGLLPGDSTVALDALADLFGIAQSGSSSSFAGALQTLTSSGAAAFNANTPDSPGVTYMSIAGRSNLAGADACPPGLPLSSKWDSQIDPMNAALVTVDGILAAATFPNTPTNDGLVTVESATWGEFLGCIPADHFNEVCQIAGTSPGIGNGFDCLEFYGDLEQLLADRGF